MEIKHKKTILALLLIAVVLVLIVKTVDAESSFVFKKGDTIDLKIPVVNSDNSPVSSSTKCNITIRDSDQNIIISEQATTFTTGGLYNYTVTDTSDLGVYPTALSCSDGSDHGFTTFNFEITNSGSVLTTGESIVYIIFLIAMIFMFLLSLYGAIKIPFRNQRNENGLIISINDMKYLKVFLIVTCYLLLMFISGIVKSIMENYLFINGAYRVFNWMFWIMFSMVYPLIIVSVIFTLILYLSSKKLKRALERGLPVR